MAYPPGGAAFPGQGGGHFAQQSSAAPAHRAPSPGFAAGVRASSRHSCQSDGGMAGCLMGAAYGEAAHNNRAQDNRYGGEGYRASSPGVVAGGRASSRQRRQSDCDMVQCLGGAAYGDAAYERPQANFAAPAPPAVGMNI